MQATDIFFLKADICQLGVDQRKVNMLAREYCDSAGIKNKPIILSHHMLYGLKKGQEKMSKSDPDSAIFMEDTPEDVARKLGNAYCPATAEEDDKKAVAEGEEIDAGLESMHLVENDLKNPCLDYVEHIIFSVPEQVCCLVTKPPYYKLKALTTVVPVTLSQRRSRSSGAMASTTLVA
jgi:tyrosyl-tRNA synthetase